MSHPGLVRAGNEDSAFLGPTCALVADGVGGAAAGEIASATVAHVLSTRVLAHPQDDPVESLRAGVRVAQEQVADAVRRDAARTGMATTLTAVVTDGYRFALAHVGDSRGYVLREEQLQRITTDHTYVQRMVQEGRLAEPDVAGHPWRHVVLRSLGGDPAEQADVRPIHLAPGDRLLLASDGLTDLVAEARIEHLLQRHPDDVAVELLLDAALEAGGRDNVTVLLATVVDRPATEAAADREESLLGAVRDPHNVVGPVAPVPHTA